MTVSLGDAITEAAVGGDIDARGKVQIDAESIYFDNFSWYGTGDWTAQRK